MSKRQAITSSSSTIRNSTCKSVGHDWKSGLDPHYRTCGRSQCRAAERLVNGAWIDTTRPSPARQPQPVTHSSSSSLLWNTDLYDGLHTGWPPPGYDPKRERELERLYYKAVADEQRYRATLTRRQRGGV
jgi:hypothetical protein